MQDIHNKKSYRINKKTRPAYNKRRAKIQEEFKKKGLRIGYPNPNGNIFKPILEGRADETVHTE